jgi:hypothetical protein
LLTLGGTVLSSILRGYSEARPADALAFLALLASLLVPAAHMKALSLSPRNFFHDNVFTDVSRRSRPGSP